MLRKIRFDYLILVTLILSVVLNSCGSFVSPTNHFSTLATQECNSYLSPSDLSNLNAQIQELDISIALRDQYKDQILASIANLETQANAISQEANTLTGESYNSGYIKPNSLAGYKEELESLQDEFTSLVTSGNTFGMAEASYILTQEVQLYKDLVNDYFASSIQPIVDESTESGNETPPAEEVVETPSRLSTLDTPIKVIRYTTNLINRQKTTFANRLTKLDQEVNQAQSDLSSSQAEIERLLQEREQIDALFLELDNDLEQIINLPDQSGFSIQQYHRLPLPEKYNKMRESRNKRVQKDLDDYKVLEGLDLATSFPNNPVGITKFSLKLIGKEALETVYNKLGKEGFEAFAKWFFPKTDNALAMAGSNAKAFKKPVQMAGKSKQVTKRVCDKYACRSAVFIAKFNVIRNPKIIKDLDRIVKEAGVTGGVKGLKNNPNVALTTGKINGIDIGEIKGIANPTKNSLPGFSNASYIPDSERILTKALKEDARKSDSEVHMLETLAQRFKGQQIQEGSEITIKSERAPCSSCENVIQEFSEKLKPIKINIEYIVEQ